MTRSSSHVSTHNVGSFGACRWNQAFLQADGRPLFTGYTTLDFSNVNVFVMRLTTSGAPVPDLWDAGEATVDISGMWDEAQAIAVQPDGKNITGGRSFASIFGNSTWSLSRLTSSGALEIRSAPVGELRLTRVRETTWSWE